MSARGCHGVVAGGGLRSSQRHAMFSLCRLAFACSPCAAWPDEYTCHPRPIAI